LIPLGYHVGMIDPPALADEEVEFYRREGYLIVRNVLSSEEILGLQEITDDFIDSWRLLAESSSVIELDTGHTPEQPRIRRTKSPHRHHEIYAATLTA